MSKQSSPPRVFVSYSDDSAAHDRRVLELAQWLRSHGVDAQIDQFEDSPDEGWPRWVYRQIRESDYVLVIATPGYLRRCEGEEPRTNTTTDTAAKFGSHLSLQELHESGGRNRKFIPVLFDADAIVESVPLPLRGATCYRLPDQLEDLYRRLTGQPKVERAPLGVLKTFDDESLLDYDEDYAEAGARARAPFDEQRAEDSLRAIIDAGVLDGPDPDERREPAPPPRWRRSWWQRRTNQQWLVGVAAFGLAFTSVGYILSQRASQGGEPSCRIQLTDGAGEVVTGIGHVVLELPSGDALEVVVEDGRTLKFACQPGAVQAQAHVFFAADPKEADPSESVEFGDQVASNTPRAASARGERIDGRILLPDPAEAELVDGVYKTRIMQIPREPPLPSLQAPPDLLADPAPDNTQTSAPEPIELDPDANSNSAGYGSQLPLDTPKFSLEVRASSPDRTLAARLAAGEDALRRCYERGLTRDPKLSGRLVADVRITATGKVAGVAVKSDLSDPSVGKCVIKLVEGWKLGKRDDSRGDVTTMTISFARN